MMTCIKRVGPNYLLFESPVKRKKKSSNLHFWLILLYTYFATFFESGKLKAFSKFAGNCSRNEAKGNCEANSWKGNDCVPCASGVYLYIYLNPKLETYIIVFILYIFMARAYLVLQFLANDFVVMLFHYDGVVDEWSDLGWSGQVIHISAMNQTKWWLYPPLQVFPSRRIYVSDVKITFQWCRWFAKRFLHPDIVAEYDYIFLWDEDLRVENFHPGRLVCFEICFPAWIWKIFNWCWCLWNWWRITQSKLKKMLDFYFKKGKLFLQIPIDC